MAIVPILDSWLGHEERWLAPYAMRASDSLGRKHPEDAHPYRSAFQRDRERIVHSSAFRRMTGKTQVLVASVNDHHRTRLTHTLEVVQVARTVARRLQLNEDLTEAIALSHDIGHPPFGHSGEHVLDECLQHVGGFDHNLYGLRRVDVLEERYPEFPGLNLTFELREAFVRHSQRKNRPEVSEYLQCGSPLLEAQVVDVVDSIAYDTHDLDDALGIGLITLADVSGIEFWREAADTIRQRHPTLDGHAFRTAVGRDLLARLVTDLLDETSRRVADAKIRNIADVRSCTVELVAFSERITQLKTDFEQFLRERVYRHHHVLRMTATGKRVLKALFHEYNTAPELLPERHLRRWQGSKALLHTPNQHLLPGRSMEKDLERVIADYLAGMTDRFAHHEYRRLFSPSADL